MDPCDRSRAIVKEVMAKSDAHQGKTNGHMETTELTTEQRTEFLKAVKEILANMMTQREADRKARREEIEARTKATQAETEAIRTRMRARQDKMIEADSNARRKETMACQEMTEVNPEKMEAIVHSTRSERDEKIRRTENVTERRKIRKEGAAVARLECEGARSQREWNPERNVNWSLRKRSY
jgi:hypothetical protein